jgi:hypothetical protein
MVRQKLFSFSIIFFSILSFYQAKAAESTINISPIVQIISYYDVYGKYPMMM